MRTLARSRRGCSDHPVDGRVGRRLVAAVGARPDALDQDGTERRDGIRDLAKRAADALRDGRACPLARATRAALAATQTDGARVLVGEELDLAASPLDASAVGELLGLLELFAQLRETGPVGIARLAVEDRTGVGGLE
jgi:hypothetical protein